MRKRKEKPNASRIDKEFICLQPEKPFVSPFDDNESSEIEELLSNTGFYNTPVDDARITKVWSAIEKDLLMQQERSHRRSLIWIQRLINTAACLIVIAAIALPAAVANNAWFRSIVFKLTLKEDASGITAKLEPNTDEAFWVPAEWKGIYFPSDIIDDFHITAINSNTSMELIDRSQRLLLIEEHLPQEAAWINTVDKTIGKLNINEKELYIIEGGSNCTILLPLDERLLVISSDSVAKGELIEICSSVKHVIR